jgi:hypothetical protein
MEGTFADMLLLGDKEIRTKYPDRFEPPKPKSESVFFLPPEAVLAPAYTSPEYQKRKEAETVNAAEIERAAAARKLPGLETPARLETVEQPRA